MIIPIPEQYFDPGSEDIDPVSRQKPCQKPRPRARRQSLPMQIASSVTTRWPAQKPRRRRGRTNQDAEILAGVSQRRLRGLNVFDYGRG